MSANESFFFHTLTNVRHKVWLDYIVSTTAIWSSRFNWTIDWMLLGKHVKAALAVNGMPNISKLL